MGKLPDPFFKIQFFADLSRVTLQQCKSLASVICQLGDLNISYSWGFPTKLTITHQGHTYILHTYTIYYIYYIHIHILCCKATVPSKWGLTNSDNCKPPRHATTKAYNKEWLVVGNT